MTEEEEKELYEDVYALQGIFIKSVRFDDQDFWGKFLVGMLEQEYLDRGMPISQIREALRKGDKGKFKVTKDGVVERIFYKGQFPKIEKDGFSKKQSVSFVDLVKKYLPPVFGHDTRDALTGIMFFSDKPEKDNHVLPSIIMQYDEGTVNRPYHFNRRDEAETYYKKKTAAKIWHEDVASLVTSGLKRQSTHNEILARIRWLKEENKCQIGIFTDNLKSRLIAQLRSADVKVNTKQSFVPISFYISDNKENPVFPYLLAEQSKDLELGLKDQDQETKAIALLSNFLNGNQKINLQQVDDEFWKLCFGEKISGLSKQLVLDELFKAVNIDNPEQNIIKEISCIAAITGDTEKLKILIQKANRPSMDDLLVLVQLASDKGNNNTLKWLLAQPEMNDYLLDYKDDPNIFLNAVARGDKVIVEWLLDYTNINKSINYNTVDVNDRNAFLLAVKNGNIEMVKLLLQHSDKIEFNPSNDEDNNAFLLAIEGGNIEIVKLLLQHSDKIEVNPNAFLQAVHNNYTEIVKLLLQHSDKINFNNDDPSRGSGAAFLVAISNQNTEMVQLLLDNSDKIKLNKDYYTMAFGMILEEEPINTAMIKLFLSKIYESMAPEMRKNISIMMPELLTQVHDDAECTAILSLLESKEKNLNPSPPKPVSFIFDQKTKEDADADIPASPRKKSL